MFERFKKIGAGTLLAIILAVSVTGVFIPEKASAQAVVVVESIPDRIEKFIKIAWEGLKTASLNAVIRMSAYAIRQVTYDSAVWLATGGKGQTPFANVDSPGAYLSKVADEAAGTALESYSKGIGFNLCKIPDIKTDLALKVGLRTNLFSNGSSGPQGKPACTLTQFKDEWFGADENGNSKFLSKYGANKISERFNLTLRTDDSPLGVTNVLTSKINQSIQQATFVADKKRTEDGQFKRKETTGERTLTPAALIEEQFKGVTPDKTQSKDYDQLQSLIASGDVKVIPAAMSIFLNTLVGTAVKNYQEKGILPFGISDVGTNGTITDDIASQYYAMSGGGGVAQAQQFFSSIKTLKIGQKQNYDILAELANCPDSPGTYNCRLDDDFVTALRQSETGKPITIQEALDKGWLHGNWKLIPPAENDAVDPRNSSKDCYQNSYCYGNIQVLRQLRILPLGFEIAAKNSPPSNPWTLEQVVRGFQSNVVECQETSPFCHLVDPNWVLKTPMAKCNAYVYGPSLVSDGVPDRLQECVDLQSCVKYDKNGQCEEYGYCTMEKNTWAFDAQKCDAQYTTCKAFTNSTGQNVSYLFRTLDSQYCNKDNVGCLAYSFTKNSAGWIAPASKDGGINTGAYFNANLSTSCSANSAGCSAFKVASDSNTIINIKKAPDYLKCYDSDPASKEVEWPKTPSDLSRINGGAECRNYAGACIQDELSCNFYTMVNGGTKIPGKFTPAEIIDGAVKWNDQCDEKCVGYDTYRELPSNYSGGQAVAYIIPSSGQTCTAAEEGCSAFTNLNETENGLEKIEHFSYLRPCVKAGENVKSRTYVTYEGTVEGGYQIKTFNLLENEDLNNGPLGAPKYFYKTLADLENQKAQCDEQLYKNNLASPDCRQFNDEKGNIFYRLISYTIPVSSYCTPYRLSSAEMYALPASEANSFDQCQAKKGLWKNDVCNVCFQNGEYRDGSCFYDGLPASIADAAGNSRGCSASVDTCRAYKGNAGNNIEVAFNDLFELVTSTAGLTGWSGGRISSESTHVGGHSLEFSGSAQAVRTFAGDPGESYDLTFWAKGTTGGNVAVKFGAKGASVSVGSAKLGDSWNYYRLGPFNLTGNNKEAEIVFVRTGDRLFLDNIKLVKVKELQYLVKKSLSIDSACDSNKDDNLPGEALGCRAYTDPNGKKYNLVGFSSLCREGAVGCTAVLETQNTLNDAGAIAYNVKLSGPGGISVSAKVGEDTYSCIVQAGRNSCYVTVKGHTASEIKNAIPGSFDASTVYIPADRASNDPIYLVANKAATCNAVDVGCVLAGAQKLTPNGLEFVTKTIKNDPATYDTTLCKAEEMGCNAYSESYFFKDPSLTGQKTCTYRENVRMDNGTERDGWFWKNVGRCSDTTAASPEYCVANSDCNTGATCAGINEQPCYRDYLINGKYGVWSAGNTEKYKNFVAECPQDQDKCTEFVDHNDIDAVTNEPRHYYFIKDYRVSEGDCSGQVSQKFGCALFDQVDNPNKFFNTRVEYDKSEAQNGNKIIPTLSNAPSNDANIIVKVARDRECGQWLACNTRSIFDVETGKYKEQCTNIKLSNGTSGARVESPYTKSVLTDKIYRNRQLGWKNMEYSGYSIWGVYPLEELKDINFSSSSLASEAKWGLVKQVACDRNNCADGNETGFRPACKNENQPCGARGEDDGLYGLCVKGSCIKAIDGSGFSAISELTTKSRSLICRGYPEKDSPFPFTSFIVGHPEIYGYANKCGEINDPTFDQDLQTACDCDYTKVKFGDSITKYWSYHNPNTSGSLTEVGAGKTLMVCSGGERPGQACSADTDCPPEGGTAKCIPYNPPSEVKGKCYDGTTQTSKECRGRQGECPDKQRCLVGGEDIPGLCIGGPNGIAGKEKACQNNSECPDGACVLQESNTKFIGQRGYCLEWDTRSIKYGVHGERNCLTWFPGRTNGTADLYNQFIDAGFNVAQLGYKAGPYYCGAEEMWTKTNGELKTETIYFDCGVTNVFKKLIYNNAESDINEILQGKGVIEGLQILQGSSVVFKDEDDEVCEKNHGDRQCQGSPYVYVSALTTDYINQNFCPAGTRPGKIINANISTSETCSSDHEQKITINYYCAYNNLTNWEPAPANNQPTPSNEYGRVEWEKRCKTLFQIADDPNEVIASTQYVWKPDNFGITVNDSCAPFAATSLDKAPVFDRDVNKWFVDGLVSLGNSCTVSKSIDPSPDTARKYEAKQSFGDYYLNYLKEIFPVSVRKFSLKAAGDFGVEKKCHVPASGVGKNGEAYSEFYATYKNGRSCETSDDCLISCNDPDMYNDSWCRQQCTTEQMDARMCGAYGSTGNPCLGVIDDPICRQICTVNVTSMPDAIDKEYYVSEGEGWNYVNGSKPEIRPVPPKVRGVEECRLVRGQELCREGGSGLTLSVNDQLFSSGVVKLAEGAEVDMRFFAFADNNQMPIREVAIDWGETDVLPGDGDNYKSYDPAYYRNQRGALPGECVEQTGGQKYCVIKNLFDKGDTDSRVTNVKCTVAADCRLVEVCEKEDVTKSKYFGIIKDKTCNTGYNEFKGHAYYCERNGANYLQTCSNGDIGNLAREFPQGCCVFTPRVHVKDNWGWCTGSCNYNGVGGCFDGGQNQDDKCDVNAYGKTSWVQFGGKVVVPAQAE